MQERYFDTSEDVHWAIDVHCTALPESHRAELRRYPRALVLYGNEDCPEQIDIYSTSCPMNGEPPMVRLTADNDGDLTQISYPAASYLDSPAASSLGSHDCF